jgi:hypothetical protein
MDEVGVKLHKEPHRKVKDNRQTCDGAFGKVLHREHREHRACLCGKMKRKRRSTGGAGQQCQLAMCDNLEQLWTAAVTKMTDF